MAEYSRLAKGSFTSTGNAKMVNLPFMPDYVEIRNVSAWITPAQNGIPFATWDANYLNSTPANVTLVEVFNATPVLTTDSVLTNGISVFSGGLAMQYGPSFQIASITKANPAVITTASAHGYTVGDTVVMQGLFQSATTGMPQMNWVPFTISAVTSTTFTVKWDSSGSNYSVVTGSPAGAVVKKVLYPFLYLPQDNIVSFLTLSTTTTVTTTMYHNFEVGQEVAFRVPNAWGTRELNALPNVLIPGSPIYGYVISVTDNWTFVVNINSSAMTAFTVNQTVASVPGLTYAQVLSVGDVNTGGLVISAGSPLYPSPQFPTSTTRIPTINGPAIRGAFVNNTSQGFVVGAGTAVTATSAVLVGANTNLIEWRAFLHDYSNP